LALITATHEAIATSVAGTRGTPATFHHAAHQTTSVAYSPSPGSLSISAYLSTPSTAYDVAYYAANHIPISAYPSTPIAAYDAEYYTTNLPITAAYLPMSTTCHATKYPQDSTLNFPSKSNNPRWKEINHTSSRIKSYPLMVSNVFFKSRVIPSATSSLKVSMPLKIKSSREGKNQSIERKDPAPIMQRKI
jgi:hypothetical protein